MAKGRDHEIVRAFETHPKAVPWTNEIEFCVVTGLQDICDLALNLFQYHLLHVGSGTQ